MNKNKLLLICFPEEIKRMEVHHIFLNIDEKILSLLLHLLM